NQRASLGSSSDGRASCSGTLLNFRSASDASFARARGPRLAPLRAVSRALKAAVFSGAVAVLTMACVVQEVPTAFGKAHPVNPSLHTAPPSPTADASAPAAEDATAPSTEPPPPPAPFRAPTPDAAAVAVEVQVSGLTLDIVSNGYGPLELDMSNGDIGANDGT